MRGVVDRRKVLTLLFPASNNPDRSLKTFLPWGRFAVARKLGQLCQ